MTALTDLSGPSRHTLMPAVPDVVVLMRCVQACVGRHTESPAGEMMTCAPGCTESPNKRIPAPTRREDRQYQPAHQQVSWDLCPEPRVMNESSPLICLRETRGVLSTGRLAEDIQSGRGCEEKGENVDGSALRTLLREMCRGKEKSIDAGCLQRFSSSFSSWD